MNDETTEQPFERLVLRNARCRNQRRTVTVFRPKAPNQPCSLNRSEGFARAFLKYRMNSSTRSTVRRSSRAARSKRNSAALLRVDQCQVKGDHGHVIAIPLGHESVTNREEGFFSTPKMPEAQSYLSFHPREARLGIGVRACCVRLPAGAERVCRSVVVALVAQRQGEVVVEIAEESRVGFR